MKLNITRALALLVLVGCASHLTSSDRSELTAYSVEQTACIAAHPGPANKQAQDQCIIAVKKRWCDQWRKSFDAGVCP